MILYDICLSPSDLLQYVNSMIISTSIHVAANGMISFFFMTEYYDHSAFFCQATRGGGALGFLQVSRPAWAAPCDLQQWPHCIEGESMPPSFGELPVILVKLLFPSIWVAITKYHRQGGLRVTEMCFSHFWRLEVQDQATSTAVFGWEPTSSFTCAAF